MSPKLYRIDILLDFLQVSWSNRTPVASRELRNLTILPSSKATMIPSQPSLLLPFAIICFTLINGARIDKLDGGYENILVAINPSVKYDENIITNVKVSSPMSQHALLRYWGRLRSRSDKIFGKGTLSTRLGATGLSVPRIRFRRRLGETPVKRESLLFLRWAFLK